VILGKQHLWRHNDRRLNCQLRRRIANYNLWRRDLRLREFGEPSFGRGQRIVISSTPTPSDHFVRCPKDVGVRSRCSEDYNLSPLGRLDDDLMPHDSACGDEAQQYNVNDR
jgi:hypothetical protein